jgi:hypothetical protein
MCFSRLWLLHAYEKRVLISILVFLIAFNPSAPRVIFSINALPCLLSLGEIEEDKKLHPENRASPSHSLSGGEAS